jgi:hypothetical protein
MRRARANPLDHSVVGTARATVFDHSNNVKIASGNLPLTAVLKEIERQRGIERHELDHERGPFEDKAVSLQGLIQRRFRHRQGKDGLCPGLIKVIDYMTNGEISIDLRIAASSVFYLLKPSQSDILAIIHITLFSR